jgi:DNA-binding transcriptional ArsR family regulator
MASANDQSLADLAAVCNLFSDKTRLQIVFLLAKGVRNVTSLRKELKVKQPTVSHHLGLLRMNRLVVPKRKGKQIIYSLAENINPSSGKLKISLPNAIVTVEGY